MQISNDAKLNMADGAYNDFQGLYPQYPRGIHRTWAWPSPTWRCPTSTTSTTYQPGATSGHVEWPDEEASDERWASWGRAPTTPTPREGFFILGFSGNSPTGLWWCDRPLGGRQVALHYRVHVWTTSLYRVSKDSIYCVAAQRRNWSMVGFLHRCHTRFLRPKTRCSSYVCPGSSCHTYGQNVSIEYQCLYYIVSCYKNYYKSRKD
jgi:hypothetical protein